MKYIKDHHCFKIVRDDSDKAVIYTKQWSTDKEWMIAASKDDDHPYFLSSHPELDVIRLAQTQYHKIAGKFSVLHGTT